MIWKYLPKNIPTDTEEVWVRVRYYYHQPFLATWDETEQSFTSTDNSIIYPAWTIARWAHKS